VGYYTVGEDDESQLSPERRTLIDQEVSSLIEESGKRVRNLLVRHRGELERIKEALMEYETLTGDELKEIINGGKIRQGEKA
jgi:cell division protease FtsH